MKTSEIIFRIPSGISHDLGECPKDIWLLAIKMFPAKMGVDFGETEKHDTNGLARNYFISGMMTERQNKETPVQKSENTVPVPKSLDGCPFMYCDSNPKCEGKCRYK